MTHTDDGDPTVSKTLIDHFSTNKPNYILNVDIIETGMVDHYMIYGMRKVNASRRNSFKKQRLAETRSSKRYNKALFQQVLSLRADFGYWGGEKRKKLQSLRNGVSFLVLKFSI